MSFIPKTWADLPVELQPAAGETPAQWLSRIAAYDAANPGVLTVLDAAGLNDFEGRIDAALAEKASLSTDSADTGKAIDAFTGGSLPVGSGLPSNPVVVTADHTASAGDIIQADATTAPNTQTLPTSPTTGALVTVVKTDSSTNAVTVAPAAGGTISGDTDVSLDSQHALVIVEHLGSNAWQIVAMVAVGAATTSTPSEVWFFGHSFVTGTGGTAVNARNVTFGRKPSSGYGYTQRVALMLGAGEYNQGFGGSQVQASGSGSWTDVFAAFAMSPRRVATNLSARAQVISNDWGINENGAAAQAGMVLAYRAVLCMQRLASRARSDDSSSVATTGGTVVGNNSIYQGDRLISYNANGNTVTVTVPSWFPGGELDLFFIGSDTKGGILSFTVDGTAAGTLDIRATTLQVAKDCPAVQRFTGLAAGAHTIVATLGSMNAGGGPWFDSWGVPAPVPPLIIVNGATPTGSVGTAPSRQTLVNGNLESLVAEFPVDEVKYYDRDALIPDQATFDAWMNDGTHPTDWGHAVLAKGLADLILASSFPSSTVYATA